ncbi:MAG: Chaperone protein YajL [Firmicutes bacterium ADurb.Bin300]|nr:MAG: Chaperone protein YajL [Firmicutes bacterium ADurb.Bin300]
MVYLFLAEGFEEVEAIATIDFLRRAGIDVFTVSLSGIAVLGAHGILIEADALNEKLSFGDELEGIILPGGAKGTEGLGVCEEVEAAIKFCYENNRLIAAICAAPTILAQTGILEGKKATCYPGLENKMDGARIVSDNVVVQGNIITGKAAGVTWEFAAAITEYLRGKDKANDVLESIQWNKS